MILECGLGIARVVHRTTSRELAQRVGIVLMHSYYCLRTNAKGNKSSCRGAKLGPEVFIFEHPLHHFLFGGGVGACCSIVLIDIELIS